MENITLDFSDCKYIGTIYQRIKAGLDLPYEYGENYDALWDAMRSYWKEDVCITIKGLHTLSKELREYMQGIINVFHDIHEETPNVTFTIIS